jgi:hypothetical protein
MDLIFGADILRSRAIDSRRVESIYGLHLQGLRPRRMEVVGSFKTPGTSSSVTQCSKPQDLHRQHQCFGNLKCCKVYTLSYIGNFSCTVMSSGFYNLNRDCKTYLCHNETTNLMNCWVHIHLTACLSADFIIFNTFS